MSFFVPEKGIIVETWTRKQLKHEHFVSHTIDFASDLNHKWYTINRFCF